MTKELLIVILVLVVLYLYYQSQKPNLVSKGTQTEESESSSEYSASESEEGNEEFFEASDELVSSEVMTSQRTENREQRTENREIADDWFSSCGEETFKEYLRRKYLTTGKLEEIYYFLPSENRKKYSFQDKEYVWDNILYEFEHFYIVFPLINVDDLTELVRQLDIDNWQNLEFMKKFGINSFCLEVIKKEESKLWIILDNLANQILARCVIVADRLTHGIDKEFEENIMSVAFMFQKCSSIPKPRAIQENNEQFLEEAAKIALNGNKIFLSRLQDLPYLNPKYKL